MVKKKKTSGYYRDEFGRMARYYDAGLKISFRFIGGEHKFRDEVMAAASVEPGHRVLDVDCGTGTLALMMVSRVAPGGSVDGIDLSDEMIRIARGKAGDAAVTFQVGNAEDLPYADASFDCVTISLAYHEMNREGRRNALAEIRRVLKPGGRLVVADLKQPDTLLTRFGMRVLLLWETDTLTDMWESGIVNELEDGGFAVNERKIAGRRFLEIVTAMR